MYRLHFSIGAVLWCAVRLVTLVCLSLFCLPICLVKMYVHNESLVVAFACNT